MDRVGFKAIDFTTSTHMGVAVRYKREDPWERIRLTAAATPNTPLQFMSTGFRFISWETASPEFMALAFEVLARSEEHTSELQSQSNLVCRLLLEKKKKQSRDMPQSRLIDPAASVLRIDQPTHHPHPLPRLNLGRVHLHHRHDIRDEPLDHTQSQ